MKAALKQHGFKLTVIVLLVALALSMLSWLKQDRPPLPSIKQAPDFSLLDMDGQPVKLSDSHGKVRLISFMFTSCPDICPMTTYNMVKLQNDLKQQGLWGDQVQFLSITFDPLTDTPEVFSKYGERMGVDPSGWTLLTGTEKETADVAKSFGVVVQKMPDGSFAHTVTSLFLVDTKGKIRKIYPMGEDMNHDELMKMIRLLAGSA
ncbi:SCO family protein [Paenibacillus puerhi]|uniref:SCO family protein n=1 Tax=Paenibacillus puerhi TaxID=2692622 RepID=UPI0013572C11|nr:SCO family protein [Paenibacillus puerhi]